jgi:hypothetical protein
MAAESFIRISTNKVVKRCKEILKSKPKFYQYGKHQLAKTLILMCNLTEESGEDTIYMTVRDVRNIFENS